MNDRKKWRERAGVSVRAERHDDDDDDDEYQYWLYMIRLDHNFSKRYNSV